MFIQRITLFIVCLFSVWGISLLVDRGKIMTPEITVPYFSGAALLNTSENWTFNLAEVDSLKKLSTLSDLSERKNAIDNYRFSTIPDSTHIYQLNQPGLVYIIFIAKKIFPFKGDIGALKHLQLLIHVIFCYFILLNLKTRKKQLLFFLLYFINPAIIYLTLFPFYYFWQVIGSYILLLVILNQKYQKFFVLCISAILLAGIYHIRISTFSLSVFILVIGFHKTAPIKRLIALSIFFLGVYFMQPSYLSKHPGHVMYSSLGAYPNSPVKGFSDNISFENYSNATGTKFSYESTPSMYDSDVIMGEAKWGLKEFLKFSKEHPFIILRNAVLNVFESFSFGYFTTSMTLTYLSAFLGFCFLVLILIRKKHTHVILLLASSCSYIFYLAPVPIYLYGTYILLLYVFIEAIEKD